MSKADLKSYVLGTAAGCKSLWLLFSTCQENKNLDQQPFVSNNLQNKQLDLESQIFECSLSCVCLFVVLIKVQITLFLLQVKVAEAVLPYITYIVLKEVDDIIPTLQEKINSFFYNHFQLNRNLSYPYEKESK